MLLSVNPFSFCFEKVSDLLLANDLQYYNLLLHKIITVNESGACLSYLDWEGRRVYCYKDSGEIAELLWMFHLASGSVNVCLIQLFGCCLKVLFKRSLKQLKVACCVLAQMVDCGGPEIRTEMRTQTILLSFLSLHRDLPSKPWHEGHSFF